MTITRAIELSDITPEELAFEFANMDDQEQADFFAAIRPIAGKWNGAGWCAQSCSINQRLNTDGRFVVETLASHLPAETLERLAKQAVS